MKDTTSKINKIVHIMVGNLLLIVQEWRVSIEPGNRSCSGMGRYTIYFERGQLDVRSTTPHSCLSTPKVCCPKIATLSNFDLYLEVLNSGEK